MDIPEFDEIFKQIRISFWFIGIPFDQRGIKLRYFIFYIILWIIIGGELVFFFTNISAENFLKLTELAPCACMGVLSPMKLVYITYNRQTIFEFTRCLKQLYNELISDPKKKEVVKRNFIYFNYFLKYFWNWHWFMVSFYNYSALGIMFYYYYTENVVVYYLPYYIWVPFPMDTWYRWLIVYITSIVAAYICVLYFLMVDGLFYIMTSHICAQFAVLSNEIEHLDTNTSHCLGGIVKKHQYILKLSEDLEEIFRAPNLFNVMIGSIEICALGFNLTMGPYGKFLGFVLFLVATLIQIFMINFFGENLINESRKIGEAAYLCKWYDMDKISKKNILILMLRSHRPQEVTAYKFSVLSYASFTKVIGNSWSYFTILKTVYE